MSELTITVRDGYDGTSFPVAFTADPTTFTVLDLKKEIELKCPPPCPPELQRIIFRGRVLRDAESLCLADFTVSVRMSDGTSFSVAFTADPATFTVLDLKKEIEPKCTPPCPPEQQKIVFRGKILKDADSLELAGIENGHTVHLVRSKTTTTASSAPAPASSTTTGTRTTIPRSGGMPGFMDPDMLSQMMQNPMVQSMLENPELMRSMMMANPTTRRLMDENPELAAALSDPETMRTMSRAATNPEVMRELMRHNDVALRNIENLPGGFDALRRMYETIQAPLEEGLRDPMYGSSTEGSSTSTTPAAPSSDPLPNPWARSSGTSGGSVPPAFPSFPMFGFPTVPAATGVGSSTTPSTGGVAAGSMARVPGTTSTSTGGAPAPASTPAAANPFAAMLGGGGMGGGFPGMGMGAMPGMGGGLPGMDPSMMSMLSDPGMQEMMVTMLSSPGFMESLEASNPQMRSMFEAMPQMRDMMRNPEFIRSMLNPQMLAMVNAMRGGAGGGGGMPGMMGFPGMMGGFPLAPAPATPSTGTPPSSSTGGSPAPAPAMPDFSALMSMLGGMGMGGGMPPMPAAPAPSTQPPAELYAPQITQMEELGFTNREQNIRALQSAGGNVNVAINRIMDGLA